MKNYRKLRNSMFLFRTCAAKLVAIIALMTLGMTEAPAGMIMFTHEGNGSGTLADNPFPVSHFVITAVGDTGDRASFLSGWSIDHSWVAISIDGVGDFEFLTGTRTFVVNYGMVGFSRAGINGTDMFDGPTDAQFATWDMLGPIGPISGLGSLFQWAYAPLIDTTGGILKFDSSYNINATFTAVPEPGTILMFGLGALIVRRKCVKTACKNF